MLRILSLLLMVAGHMPDVSAQQLDTVRTAAPIASINSVEDAIALAMERSPLLQAADAKRRASLGEKAQASALPNPDLTLDVENAGGSGPYRGFRSSEITLGVSQRIETGGKRTARVNGATAGATSSEHEYAAARLDVTRDVTRAYAEVIGAARTVETEREQARLVDEVLRVAKERVAAGKEPVLHIRKAEVARTTATLALERASRQLGAAVRALSILLGAEVTEIVPDQRWYESIGEQRPVQSYKAIPNSPDHARWDSDIARSRAVVQLEQANAVPDVTLGAGVRHFRDTDDTAIVLGFTVPLPVFNTNRGAIDRAKQELVRTEAQARGARLALDAAVADAAEQLDLAWGEADTIRRIMVSAAEEAFAFARDGYAAGKFAFLEVLDTQRTYFDTRAKLNEALKEVHFRRADLERLIGARFEPSTSGSKP